ncbi:carbon starvation protein A [Desulfovibrio sp. OttesenSCG-928-G15]|nr:carbon starvation protein A [Desulfovibrio sp. OttesenSCG-928-G15]
MPSFVYFLCAVAALVGGYLVYSRVVEKMFGADHCRATPACSMADGVDYIKLPPAKAFLIQLLNIAGVGPVFGPILGALYGPSALLWIVLGSIFAGGVHDYFSGMMSLRYHGKSLPDVVGYTLGDVFKQIMRVFSVILLLLVGVVFVNAPAALLANLTPEWMNKNFWVLIIFVYYFAATILPIDVIIARLYPIFAVVLIIMAVGVAGGLIFKGYAFYSWVPSEVSGGFWGNQHPAGLPMWPLMFITIACGALSGFHATQSPLMSRCVPDEKCGRGVFYGAMIAEGIIALIWCTAGMTFYESAQTLSAAISAGSPSGVVNEVCMTLLGPIGGVLAILGVVVLPITSGDTAFRAARLVIADFMSYAQSKPVARLFIAVPLFVIGGILSQVDFNIIWRYFGWSNQTLATIVLWSAAAYIVRRGGIHWFVSLPATYMTAVVVAYICVAKEGLQMDYTVSVYIGLGAAVAAFAAFMACQNWFRKNVLLELPVPGSGAGAQPAQADGQA